MLNFVSNAIEAVGGWFKWKSTGVAQRQSAKRIVAEEDNARRRTCAEINRAVHEGDADKVNAIVNGAIVLIMMVGMVVGVMVSTGCSLAAVPVYVSADREITCTTNEAGRAVMWHVPPLVMEDLLRCKMELEELKKESRIREMTIER